MHDSGDSHLHVNGIVIYERKLTSVGIDIGSSTTHLTFSELVVGQTDSHFQRKPEILQRKIVYRSPIIFTPYSDATTIDHEAVATFVRRCYEEGGFEADDIQSGAVICTGEAARRSNARLLTESLASDTGKFVCATAGHHFEGLLAANGSGAVEASRSLAGAVVNLDIGGGTSKRTVCHGGTIASTSAINIGARLLAFGRGGIVIRAEPAALRIADALGLEAAPGRRLGEAAQERIAELMANVLLEFLGLRPMGSLACELLLTVHPSEPSSTFWLICSGGVSEYIYGDPDYVAGDLGPALGRALRQRLHEILPDGNLLSPKEGIRATVIGACQFTLQVSGETVFASELARLPMHNIPVLSVALDWGQVVAEEVAAAIGRALGNFDGEGPCGLFLGGPRHVGYSKLGELARGIAAALGGRGAHQTVLIFSQDIANTVGRELRALLPRAPYICLDEIQVANLDYLDIGIPPEGEAYYPVVVKSLIFKHQLAVQ